MKHYIKKICLAILILSIVLLSGCGPKNEEPKTEENDIYYSSVNVSDEQIFSLQQYIAIIPPFTEIRKVDNNFWHDFIFNLYTHKAPSDGVSITDESKNTWIIVEKDEISLITKELFGIEMPEYYPHEDNIYRNGTAFYILLSGTQEEVDILNEYEFSRNSNSEVAYRNCSNSSYIIYELKKSDNENGFIISSLTSTKTSPAVHETEKTTHKEVASENESIDFSLLYEELANYSTVE